MTDREQPVLRLVPALRVSTDDKGQDPGRQLDVIRAWASREPTVLLEEAFTDEGVSGDSDPLQREGFKAAVARAREIGGGIVVEAPDRLTRQGIMGYWVTVWRLRNEERVGIYVADAPLREQTGFHAELVATIRAAMAKEWLDRHRQAVKGGMDRAKAKGTRFGRKPKAFTDGELEFIRTEFGKPVYLGFGKAKRLNPNRLGYKGIAHAINKMRGVYDLVDPAQRKEKEISGMTIRRVVSAWAQAGTPAQNPFGAERVESPVAGGVS